MRSVRVRSRRRRVVMLALAVTIAIAVANGISRGWSSAVLSAAFWISVAFVLYLRAGRDSDRAAMLMGGADERQALIRRRAFALSGVVMFVAAVICGIAAIALRGIGHWGSYWPMWLVAAVGTVTYAWSGHAGDLGALFGGRADEREAVIRTRARALSAFAMAAAAAIGVQVETGLGDKFVIYWPFLLVILVGIAGYNAGVAEYGVAHGADYAPGADTECR